MKILSTVAISAILATGAIGADFIQGGYYGGVGIGVEDYSRYSSIDPGVTLVLNGGKPIIKLGPGTLGAEGEFTYTVIPLSRKYYYYYDYDYYGNYYRKYKKYDLNIFTLGAYATYTFDFSDKLYARGKLGLVNRSTNYDGHYYRNNSIVNVGAGIGAGYKINNKMRVFSDFIVLDGSDLKQFNVGLQMSF